MILGQSQVSWQHFQTPIMNNTGRNVPNISKFIIWIHMASIKPLMWYVKMNLAQSQESRLYFQIPIISITGMNVATQMTHKIYPWPKQNIIMTFPDPREENHQHILPQNFKHQHIYYRPTSMYTRHKIARLPVSQSRLEMFGTSMLVFFMLGVWKYHLDTWPCPRIILT